MIRLRKVSKTFDNGKTYAIRNLSLQIEDGETLVLLGSSGSGKTTTLKLINLLIIPTTGIVEVDGKNVLEQDVIKLRRSIGYVFQHIGLFPHMTVAENIAIVLRLEKWPVKQRQKRVKELLELINLPYDLFQARLPNELSGGQQQRVGVARALASDPQYLLMDEPFAALDAVTRSELQDEMIKLKQKLHKTIVFVTHDINEALKLGDRIAVMHQGHLEQIGTGEELLAKPASGFVKDLITTYQQQCSY